MPTTEERNKALWERNAQLDYYVEYQELKADWKRVHKELDNANLTVNVLLSLITLVSLVVIAVVAVCAQFYGGIGF
jgi:hypothetical protein